MVTAVSTTDLLPDRTIDLAPAIADGPTSLYDLDFYAWTQTQGLLLRSQNWADVDWDNVIEEIESLGRKERRELVNRLGILIGHLLKWQFQVDRRGNSWLATIREQRLQVNLLIHENPSLKASLEQSLETAYELGVILAVKETGLPFETFPDRCRYRLDDILANTFFPD